jgi:DNA-binding winged helix-turn-helix (wHTH) protein
MASQRDSRKEPSNARETYRFGDFELDARARELVKDGRRIRLQEQPFLILMALLENPGEVVTREQLRQRVWPSSVYVDFDHGLNNAMGRLREALGEGAATPRFIETLPRLGYRFICPLEPTVPRAPPAPGRQSSWRVPPALLLGLGLAILAMSGLLAMRWWATPARVMSGGSRDAEAQRLYAMGIAMQRGRGLDRDPYRAAELFQQALARDPQFTAAYAGLAVYHFKGAWTDLTAVEENTRAGRLAAERAIALDATSSEALMARADFEAWQSRSRGDLTAYLRAKEDFRRATELDPNNSAIFFNYARAVLWDEPQLSQQMFARVVDIDPLWDVALSFSALLLSQRGMHEAARTRLTSLAEHSLIPGAYVFTRGMLERQLGRLDDAATILKDLDLLQVWSVYLSLGDRPAAEQALTDLAVSEVIAALRDGIRSNMDGNYEEAYAALDRHCDEFPRTLILDLPVARLALIAGHPQRARMLLLRRLPDLARGAEPVKARNVIPALDLAAAYHLTGDQAAASALLTRIAAYLDGSDAPRWPLFVYQRARAYALSDEPDLALRELARAYAEGFRLVWGLDLYPQPLLYIDSIDQDPAFARLRTDARYRDWRERIRTDNAQQLARLRARDAATTPSH